jgi:hypothetical protein
METHNALRTALAGSSFTSRFPYFTPAGNFLARGHEQKTTQKVTSKLRTHLGLIRGLGSSSSENISMTSRSKSLFISGELGTGSASIETSERTDILEEGRLLGALEETLQVSELS